MTTTAPAPTVPTTPTTGPPAGSPVVTRFLAGIAAGDVPQDLYADGAVLDATVPGWRFRTRGAAAIHQEYRRWFGLESTFTELERHPLEGAELVRYLHTFVEDGEVKVAHHMHLLTIHDEHITNDTVFCGGRWGGELLVQIDAATHAG